MADSTKEKANDFKLCRSTARAPGYGAGGREMPVYRVTRILKEEGDIEASTKEEALELLALKGSSADITLLKETVKLLKVAP